jgi:anti-sigma B factor antagonist
MLQRQYEPPQSAPTPATFMVDVRPDRERIFVAPHGELDLATVATLEGTLDQLVADGFDRVILDLRSLSFIDSTGISLVLRQTERTDARVELIDGPEAVSRVFRLSGLDGRLPFVDARGRR